MLLLSNGVQIHLLFLPNTGPKYHFCGFFWGGGITSKYLLFWVIYCTSYSNYESNERRGQGGEASAAGYYIDASKMSKGQLDERAKGERALLTAPC